MHESTSLLTLLALTTASIAHIKGLKDQPWIGEFQSTTCSGDPVTNTTLWEDDSANTPGFNGIMDPRPEIKGSSCVTWMPALPSEEASAIGISFGTGSRRDAAFEIYNGPVAYQCNKTGFIGTVFADGRSTGHLVKSKVAKGGPGVCLVLDDTLKDMTMIRQYSGPSS